MAKGMYIGVDSKARKVKKIYAGASGKARKVKKGYIGVGGVARPFFTGGEAEYHGTIANLKEAVSFLASASTTNHLVFAGGYSSSDRSTQVTAYASNLVRSLPTPLPVKSSHLAGASLKRLNNKYAIFAGGQSSGSTEITQVVGYNEYISQFSCDPLNIGTTDMAGAGVGEYALFAGGYTGSMKNTVYAYNYIGTKIASVTTLPSAVRYGSGASNDAYAIFAGGYSGSSNYRDFVVGYNQSLTQYTGQALMNKLCYMLAASSPQYAIFGGGSAGTTQYYSKVYAYNQSLTRTVLSDLTYPTAEGAGAGTENNILLGGGRAKIGSVVGSSTVSIYDASLVKKPNLNLSFTGWFLSAGTVGEYIVFAGGANRSSYVEAFIG